MVGVGILVFFVLFCFVGPLLYHGNTVNTDLASPTCRRAPVIRSGTDNEGFDELALLMKGGQAALEVGFFAAASSAIVHRHALGRGRPGWSVASWTGRMMRVVDIFLSIPFLFVVLIVAVRYGATVLGLS